MPPRSKRLCSHPGCRAIVQGGRCFRHQALAEAREIKRQQEVNERRPEGSMSVYSTPRWRSERARYITQRPHCAHPGCDQPARYLDHMKPWRSFPPGQQDAAFWGEWNWQGLCAKHHSVKTAREDGGFGHARRALPSGSGSVCPTTNSRCGRDQTAKTMPTGDP
jgi:5-methylcytosine-specific restriction protein A